ncbi:MAG: hypothetical protein EAZ25_31115 [Oscillatoriales cyanobacterium]|nr:MAG: hypothetical protein EAZ25_31115 [Oscillatoriales cyanobacterium]
MQKAFFLQPFFYSASVPFFYSASVPFFYSASVPFFYSASVPARVLCIARERGRSHYKCKTEMLPTEVLTTNDRKPTNFDC